jgi:hypothetical protein
MNFVFYLFLYQLYLRNKESKKNEPIFVVFKWQFLRIKSTYVKQKSTCNTCTTIISNATTHRVSVLLVYLGLFYGVNFGSLVFFHDNHEELLLPFCICSVNL